MDRSKHDVEVFVRTLAPLPDVAPSIRKLPASRAATPDTSLTPKTASLPAPRAAVASAPAPPSDSAAIDALPGLLPVASLPGGRLLDNADGDPSRGGADRAGA